MTCPCQYFIILFNWTFVNVCYFNATEIFILAPKGRGVGGGGELAPFLPFNATSNLHNHTFSRLNKYMTTLALVSFSFFLHGPSPPLVSSIMHFLFLLSFRLFVLSHSFFHLFLYLEFFYSSLKLSHLHEILSREFRFLFFFSVIPHFFWIRRDNHGVGHRSKSWNRVNILKNIILVGTGTCVTE